MDDLLSEKEQIEQMRTWWSEYGNYVIAGIVLGALGLFGYNYFEGSRLDAQLAASSLYQELTDEVVDGNLEQSESLAGQILADFPDSAYAAQASLAMARLYMDKNRDQDAADTLNDLLATSAGDEFKKIARLRLAKLMLYQGKPDDVLALLGELAADDAFAARYAEVRGDAFVAKERFDDAREAYLVALGESAQASTVDQQFVQLKLQDLPASDASITPAVADPARDPSDADSAEPAAATDDPAEPAVTRNDIDGEDRE